jgi:HSP20 family protein
MFELIPYATRRAAMFNPFEDFYRDFWTNSIGEIKTDITDNGDSYKLEADLPGFKKEDIKIELDEKRMLIKAERKSESEEKDKQGYVRRERTYGSFTRSFDVSGIETGAITAAYNDGVLTLNLPKKAEQKPFNRQISIT